VWGPWIGRDSLFKAVTVVARFAEELLTGARARDYHDVASPSRLGAVSSRQCDLLRDVLGNPFRLARINQACLTWNDGTIPKLAQGIYDDRAFDRLPILADALEDAGCDNADILAHCRGPGPHVRGCWVVDLILGKS
jgi:hypothetical protein